MKRRPELRDRSASIDLPQRVCQKQMLGFIKMTVEPTNFPNERAGAQTENLFFALASVADHTGGQAGAALLIVQSLARNRLISMVDAKKLVRLFAPESLEAQRFVTAQCVARRKARPIRPTAR
jgi:hypothetical protein